MLVSVDPTVQDEKQELPGLEHEVHGCLDAHTESSHARRLRIGHLVQGDICVRAVA